MKSLNSILVLLFVLSITLCNAQIKNSKTETIKIFGNCEMCKSTIEKAGNKKKEASVQWNKDTKMAIISYDSLKTSKSEILKRVALVGYDNELFMSPDDTYANLPGCCQYKRTKKQIVTTEASVGELAENHSEQTTSKILETPKAQTETNKQNELTLVFKNYFEVKNALVQSDGNLTSTKANELLKSLEKVKMNELATEVHMVWMEVMNDLKADAKKMAESKELSSQRKNFITLSKNMYTLLKIANYEQPVYYQFCPMANDGKGANWLSTENTIKNPYYGSAMLSCGNTVETIK
ncbi:MAG: DUF3347 domain-containing protein [Bacteroidia bacterium]